MRYVLDASAFFGEWRGEGELFTTSSVCGELRDTRSRMRLEVFSAEGLQVQDPPLVATRRVLSTMRESGDAPVLSPTDVDLLALALDVGGAVVSDDYAIQNVAQILGIPVVPIQQRKAEIWRWRYRCTGCGKYFRDPGSCPVCGSVTKRTIQ